MSIFLYCLVNKLWSPLLTRGISRYEDIGILDEQRKFGLQVSQPPQPSKSSETLGSFLCPAKEGDDLHFADVLNEGSQPRWQTRQSFTKILLARFQFQTRCLKIWYKSKLRNSIPKYSIFIESIPLSQTGELSGDLRVEIFLKCDIYWELVTVH